MPGDPKECRQHAENCLRLAKEATTDDARKMFVELANKWMVLAVDLRCGVSPSAVAQSGDGFLESIFRFKFARYVRVLRSQFWLHAACPDRTVVSLIDSDPSDFVS